MRAARILLALLAGGAFTAAPAATPATVESKLRALELAVDHAATTLKAKIPDEKHRAEILDVAQSGLFSIRLDWPTLTVAKLEQMLLFPDAGRVQNGAAGMALLDAEPGVRQARQEFVTEVGALRDAETEAARQALQTLCVEVGETAVAASHPGDLDFLFPQLSPHSPLRLKYARSVIAPDWSVYTQLRELARSFQDYLAARDREDWGEQNKLADRNLQILPGANLPPSLAKAFSDRIEADPNRDPLPEALAACTRVEQPDDFPAAFQIVFQLPVSENSWSVSPSLDGRVGAPGPQRGNRRGNPQLAYRPGGPTGIALVHFAVEDLRRYYDELHAGDALSLHAYKAAPLEGVPGNAAKLPEAVAALGRLWRYYLLLNLAHELGASGDLLPTIHEGYQDYLTRVVPRLVQTPEDWQAFRRVLELGRRTMYKDPPFHQRGEEPDWHRADEEACRTYLLAFANDRAKQWRDAIVYYLRTQHTAAPHLPAAAITQRLALLKQIEPADYAAAEDMLKQDPKALDDKAPGPKH